MDLKDLVRSAEALKQPPIEAAEAYDDKQEALAKAVTTALSARPDIERLIGVGNDAMMADNHKNHARFLNSVFRSYHPETLVQTVLWVFRAYRAHGFHLTYWPAQLNAWLDAMRAQLDASQVAALEPFYDWMLVNQPAFATLSEQPITTPWDGAPHAD